uniref:Chitin-binding type-2 domain-containing protein n=1 Tax=Ditylenchus dipsaci TaxID=166011 RepID=A0A915EV03_9BILA
MLHLSNPLNCYIQNHKKLFFFPFALLLLLNVCHLTVNCAENSADPHLDYDGYGEGDLRPDVSQFLNSPEQDLSANQSNSTDSIEESERQMLLSLLEKDMMAEQEESEQQQQQELEHEDYAASTDHQLIGQVCMTVEPYRSVLLDELQQQDTRYKRDVHTDSKGNFSIEKNAFFECSPLSDKEAEVYGLEDKFLGVWTMRRCPDQLEFDALQQKCVEVREDQPYDCTAKEDTQSNGVGVIRRKPSKKSSRRYHWQHVGGCYAPCQDPGSLEPAMAGGNCTWLGARLQEDFNSPEYFLQCASIHAGQPCGQWIRQICPPNTVFNPTAQLCVQQSGGNGYVTTGKDRQMAPQKLLPPPPLTDPIPNYSPLLLYLCLNYYPLQPSPLSSLQQLCARLTMWLCPGRASCHEGTCCSRLGIELNIKIPLILDNQAPLCYESNVYPVSMCTDGCSKGYFCQPGVGCCPVTYTAAPAIVSAASVSASLESPNSHQTQQYVPSMLVCPAVSALARRVRPIGNCVYTPGTGNGCPTGYYCMARLRGCCPRYSSAIANHRMLYSSSSASSSASQPFDSSEVRISSSPLLCPNGSPYGPPCSQSTSKCATGYGCFRGFCCPANCPASLTPVGFCAPSPNVMTLAYYPSRYQLPSTCTSQSSCHSGVCCQPALPSLPVCSNGQLAKTHCALDGPKTCSTGFECSNGGCCPIPYCPSGIQAIGRCLGAGSCLSMPGAKCLDGLCCPPFLCADGFSPAVGVCTTGTANNCAVGNECWHGRCCPLPKCPGGFSALGRCVATIQLHPVVMQSPPAPSVIPATMACAVQLCHLHLQFCVQPAI